MERGLFEILGISTVAALSFGATKLLDISPLDPSLSQDRNLAIFVAIPTLSYFLLRIFFGILFVASSNIQYVWIGETILF